MENQAFLICALFFAVSASVALSACLIGILANIVDWLFKPVTGFLHYIANILWIIGASSMLITGISMAIVARFVV